MFTSSSDQDSKHTSQLCGFQTFQKTNLKLHKQAVHEGKQFQCPECEHQTSYNSVHIVQKLQCPEL